MFNLFEKSSSTSHRRSPKNPVPQVIMHIRRRRSLLVSAAVRTHTQLNASAYYIYIGYSYSHTCTRKAISSARGNQSVAYIYIYIYTARASAPVGLPSLSHAVTPPHTIATFDSFISASGVEKKTRARGENGGEQVLALEIGLIKCIYAQ